MSTDGNRRTLQQITHGRPELALEALSRSTLTTAVHPREVPPGAKLDAGCHPALFSVGQNRSTSVMSKLMVSTDWSSDRWSLTKVIIASMMIRHQRRRGDAGGGGSVERIRQALTRLRMKRCSAMRTARRGQVAELEGRVTALEQSASGPQRGPGRDRVCPAAQRQVQIRRVISPL